MLPASAYQLRNVAQPPDENTGGIEALWYALASDLVDFPAEGELVIDQLTLQPGAYWYQLVSTRGTVRYKQTPKDLGRHGTSQTQKLVGVLARHTPDLAKGLEALEGQPLVVLYRDFNGHVQLVGTPEQPLAWTDSYDSGQDPNQRNNYDWTLAGETPRRARPYLGTWEVSERGLQSGLQLGTSGGLVELRTEKGRLLARVPAGKSVVLRSGFGLDYQIV
ncbi:hypothetical protein GO988_15460 [Hymenobacter sp. HMF4947]|uniref:Uncharacterized protein n=1 Tax=Hymenobacter ginkgonis TaxID=2682976 RepID=A0A7K1TH34_9BACT|nr:hypothetical protein [Hymenobacter ginkgonis]MVN77730.1 hypothetical protein [Hymenobacter ginkgonis]